MMDFEQFWLSAEKRIRPMLRPYLSDFDGVVEEVGTGVNVGKVKVRRPTEEIPVADLLWSPVYGAVPAVGAVVFVAVSVTGNRRVITGGGSGGTVSDASTTTKGVSKLSVAPASATDPIAVGTNDARMADARTPTTHATSHQPGGGDAMAVDAVAATGSLRTLGTGAQQATAGNDTRLSDARTPTAHAHSGADITSGTVAVARIGTGTKNTTTFYRGDGTFAAPGGAATSAIFVPCHATASQTFPNNTAKVVPIGTTPLYNDLGTLDSTNNRWYPPAAGTYQIGASAAIDFGTITANSQWLIELWKNGVFYCFIASVHIATTRNGIVSGTVPVKAASSADYFQVFGIYRTGGGTVNFRPDESYFYATT